MHAAKYAANIAHDHLHCSEETLNEWTGTSALGACAVHCAEEQKLDRAARSQPATASTSLSTETLKWIGPEHRHASQGPQSHGSPARRSAASTPASRICSALAMLGTARAN